ncbi:MAG: MFS transporter [Propionibacteriales bacterium]|nr:MFS transporter [Propionibacteriales bacterium]
MAGRDPTRTMRYRDLFRDAEFAGMYVADVLTMSGTFLTRLAVAALVYQRTGSVSQTGAVFAASFAPHLLGPWLATLADIFPRRGLLILSDVVRCGMVLLLLIPSVPYWLVLTVVFLLELIQIPFGSSRLATLADILDEVSFPVGNALVGATRQALQVSSFAVGGVLIAATSPQTALVLDSASYLVSAVLIYMFVKRRPLPWHGEAERPRVWSGALEGLRVVRRTPHMAQWFWLLALGPGIVVISEGLAVPFAQEDLGGGTRLAGLLMGALALGNLVGFAVFGRFRVELQNRLIYPLAYSSGGFVFMIGLLAVAFGSVIPILLAIALSGAAMSYLLAIQARVAAIIPRVARGRVFGLGNTVMQLAQGTTILSAGAVADALPVGVGGALVLFGAVGVVAVSVVQWRDWMTDRTTASAAEA